MTLSGGVKVNGSGELVTNEGYVRAIAKVHPDYKRMHTNSVFAALNEAWIAFEISVVHVIMLICACMVSFLYRRHWTGLEKNWHSMSIVPTCEWVFTTFSIDR